MCYRCLTTVNGEGTPQIIRPRRDVSADRESRELLRRLGLFTAREQARRDCR
ncbi:hypothetical protein [Stackebrandtia albiflava]|uniref:hypothetical protein n=1 Tax=Stackebrandtia albiflava TaxID=406432 RepID=UPI0013152277|nr:hypothetical protein [Stackebrandtia albiflava]